MKGIFQQLERVFDRAVSTLAGLLLFGCPAAIFTLLGFANMANVADTAEGIIICAAVAGLSWAAGRAVKQAIA
jgi:hypothetical protein